MELCVSSFKERTGKTRATIIYDSTVDEFTHDRLFDKIKGKLNIAIVGFTTDGDVFGGFYSVDVTKQDRCSVQTFAFSFESHGWCMTPQGFVVKEQKKDGACMWFFKNDDGQLVGFDGNGCFYVLNEESDGWFYDLSRSFVGVEDATATGMNWGGLACCRLVSLQLEKVNVIDGLILLKKRASVIVPLYGCARALFSEPPPHDVL